MKLNNWNHFVQLFAFAGVLALGQTSASAAIVPGATPGSFSISDTGAAIYSIPIQVPPGINGMQPQLALTYSSQAGDGIAGVGWSISGMSSITRCPATIAHDGANSNHGVQYDNTDKFCLDGKRLRLDSGTYGSANAVYHFEIDDFTKITQNGYSQTSGPTSFTVQTADGMTVEYGAEASARLAVGSANSRWMINNVKDSSANQNTIHYTYSESDGVLYLDSIEYSGDATRTVEFDYENRATQDQITRYFGGSAYTQKKRLKTIRTEVSGSIVKTYNLVYESLPVSGRTNRTRLSTIQECDAASGGDCYEETEIEWIYGSDNYDNPVGSTSAGSDSANSFAMDATGDGIADIVFSDGTNWDILPGNASGGFGSRIDTSIANTNKGHTKSIDYNGDGLRDLVVGTPSGNWKILQATGTSTGFTVIDTGVATNNAEDYYTIADYDGDGLEDIVYLGGGSNFVWARRNTGGGLSSVVQLGQLQSTESFGVTGGIATSSVKAGGAPDFDGDLKADILYRYTKTTTPNCEGEPGCDPTPYDTDYWGAHFSEGQNNVQLVKADDFDDPQLGDFNGDGLTDIAFRNISANEWHIKFGNGVNFDTTNTQVSGSSATTFPFDYDADGLTDLMYLFGSTWYVLRSDGNKFEAGVTTGITDGASSSVLRLADINGDGLGDLVYVDSGNWKVIQHSDTRRDMVSKVTDGLGNYFDPTYAVPTDSNVYSAGTGASFPDFDYIGPKTLVKSYKTNNGIGDSFNTVSYFYKGWKVNAQGLGALGFSEVRESFPNNVVAARHFNQSHPTIGMVTRSTLEEREGGNDKNEIGSALLSETDFTVANHTVTGTPANNARYINYVSGITSKRYDLGGAGSSGTPLTTETTTIMAMDFNVGLPTNIDRTITDINSNTFTINTDNIYQSNKSSAWCVGIPSEIKTTMTVDGITEERRRTASNNLTACRADSETAETTDGTLEQTTNYFYDTYGNINQVDATAVGSTQTRTTTLNYSLESGYFPRTITNSLNQTQTITWDKDFGQPLTLTDPNSLVVTSLYDDFGRNTRVTYPDGVQIDITLASCGVGCIDLTSTESDGVTNGQQAFTRLDELGRPVRQGQIMLDGTTSYVHTEYDSLGRVDRVSNPTTSASTGSVWSSFEYDDLGRTKKETRPDSVSNRVTTVSHANLSTTVTLPVSSHTRVFDYDGLGQVEQVTETGTGSSGSTDTATTTYGYGPFGTLRSVSPPGVSTTNIDYNKRGWKKEIVDPDTGTTRYDYNGFGELLTLTQGFGTADVVAIDFEYDELGRVERRVDNAENKESEWTYDDAPGAGIGQPSTVSMGPVSGTSDYFRSYDYNTSGQLTSTLYAFESEQFIVDQTYNSLGRLATLTYPDSMPPTGMPDQISTSEPTSEDGSYTISWTAGGGSVTSYKIGESDDGGVNWSADVDVGTSLSKAYTGQSEDTYKYRVKSCSGTICSAYKEGADTTVAFPPNTVPSISTSESQSPDGSFMITWTTPTSGTVTKYWLSERVNGGSWSSDADQGLNLSKTYTGKTDGDYDYRVKSCNGSSCADYTTGAATDVALTPGSVGSISTNDPSSTDGQYTITWSAASGTVTNYWLSERVNGGAWGADIDRGTNTGKSYSGKGNGSYEYRVKACNDWSCTAYKTGALTAVTLPPGSVGSISTNDPNSTDGQYTITWTAASGTVTNYWLSERVNGGAWAADINRGTNTGKSYSGKGNGAYEYRVKACNGSACSGYTTGALTTVTLPPGTPASITIPSSDTDGNYTISWGAASGTVTAYKLYEATNASFTGQTEVYSGTGLSKAITKGNTQSGTYYYRVKAYNGSQGSGYRTGGNSIVVTIAPSVPPSISRNPGWLTQGGNYTISWGASTGTVTQYQLQRATNVSFSGATTVYQGTALSRLFNNAQIGTWYFRVRACNTTSVCSNYKQYAKVTVVSGGGGGGPIPWAKLELIEVDEVDEPVLASAKRQPNSVMAQRGVTTTRTTALRLTPEQQLERELKIQDLAAQFGVSDTLGNPRREWVVQQVDARLSQPPRAGSGGGGSGAGDRLKIEYAYQNGYLKDIRDADNDQTAIWEATQINQFGQITEADLGNGVTTGYSFDANTGELKTIQSGKTGVSDIQDLSYQWDDLGNLTQRKDDNISKTEDFQYDGLNRLHKAHLNSSQVLQMTYDPNGNIKSKTGTGTYDTSSSYNYTSNTHKLSSISGVSSSFTYDARGNMKTGMGRTITYSSYNKPTFIDGGSNESTFKYGPERARYFHQREFGSNISTILYTGGLFQKVTRADSVVEFRHAIHANGQEVATIIRRDDFDHEMLYHHRDHLGSVTTITDENGTVVEELSYDAFGKRRDATDWSSDLTSTIREDLSEQYDRGYTGHEQLDNLELVHMNGRVYDPSIGRFLSADPIIQAPFNSQSHNRFSYVWNNPLSMTDPSGYIGLGDFVRLYFGDNAGRGGEDWGGNDSGEDGRPGVISVCVIPDLCITVGLPGGLPGADGSTVVDSDGGSDDTSSPPVDEDDEQSDAPSIKGGSGTSLDDIDFSVVYLLTEQYVPDSFDPSVASDQFIPIPSKDDSAEISRDGSYLSIRNGQLLRWRRSRLGDLGIGDIPLRRVVTKYRFVESRPFSQDVAALGIEFTVELATAWALRGRGGVIPTSGISGSLGSNVSDLFIDGDMWERTHITQQLWVQEVFDATRIESAPPDRFIPQTIDNVLRSPGRLTGRWMWVPIDSFDAYTFFSPGIDPNLSSEYGPVDW